MTLEEAFEPTGKARRLSWRSGVVVKWRDQPHKAEHLPAALRLASDNTPEAYCIVKAMSMLGYYKSLDRVDERRDFILCTMRVKDMKSEGWESVV